MNWTPTNIDAVVSYSETTGEAPADASGSTVVPVVPTVVACGVADDVALEEVTTVVPTGEVVVGALVDDAPASVASDVAVTPPAIAMNPSSARG